MAIEQLGEKSPHPSIFLVLNLPYGITTGYIVATVPFLVTRAGLPVATAASIVAVALAPKVWKALWSPLLDLRLTLKGWYTIGAGVAGGMLLLQSFVPINSGTAPILAFVLLAAEVGVSLTVISQGALMAITMPELLKGHAAGWNNLGTKMGRLIGGGAGLWLATKAFTPTVSGIVLGFACIVCTGGLWLIQEPNRGLPRNQRASSEAVQQILQIGRELWQMLLSRDGALAIALALSPIATSGINSIWSGVSTEWKVSPKTMALVVGLAIPCIGSAGCLIAGWWADRTSRRMVYVGTGTLLAVVTGTVALAPRVPTVFIAGTLLHALAVGMCDAAFTALILSVVGRSAAATKYAILAALGNAPVLYMTVIAGRIHDHWNTSTMLATESVATLFCIGLAVLVLRRCARPELAVARQSSVVE